MLMTPFDCSKRSSYAERHKQLKSYNVKHGQLNVKNNKNKALVGYFYNIRYARRHSEKKSSTTVTKLTEDMIQSLDEIGFDWSTRKRETPK